jgi:tetratricopeptide (TPR) repeat protein
VNALIGLAQKKMLLAPDTSVVLGTQALRLSQQLNFSTGMGKAYQNLGNFYFLLSDLTAAMKNYKSAMSIWEELEKKGQNVGHLKSRLIGGIANIYLSQGDYKSALANYSTAASTSQEAGDRDGLATILGNIGTVYKNQGNYPKALEYFFRSLKINQELGSDLDISRDLGNIGTVYFRQGIHEKALEYYHKALEIDEPSGNKAGVARQQSNIGCVYLEQHEYVKALDHFNISIKMNEELGNQREIATQLCNMGSVYQDKQDPEAALRFYVCALSVAEQNNLNNIISVLNENIGAVYLSLKNYKKAEEYLLKGLAYSEAQQDLEGTRNMYLKLCQIDSIKGDFKTGLDHYRRYIEARDSITNQENTKKQIRLEMQFEFDKKQAADSIRVSEEKKLAYAELKSEKNKRYALYGGLGLVIVFAGFMYNRFLVTRKQKQIIEEQKQTVEIQKKIVEEKNKEVLDSIYYARRIQRSLLPNEKYISKHVRK